MIPLPAFSRRSFTPVFQGCALAFFCCRHLHSKRHLIGEKCSAWNLNPHDKIVKSQMLAESQMLLLRSGTGLMKGTEMAPSQTGSVLAAQNWFYPVTGPFKPSYQGSEFMSHEESTYYLQRSNSLNLQLRSFFLQKLVMNTEAHNWSKCREEEATEWVLCP